MAVAPSENAETTLLARKRGLARLKLRWPRWRHKLDVAAQRDVFFGELCEEYDRACEAADHWARAAEVWATERESEYRDLASELETLIEFRLTF
ncbi:hypothetical protein ASE66_24805 [Bosea sp. Root483D1]|nr:hypothetical protein ASE66_24805 [Bosea sp. Root483D1]